MEEKEKNKIMIAAWPQDVEGSEDSDAYDDDEDRDLNESADSDLDSARKPRRHALAECMSLIDEHSKCLPEGACSRSASSINSR